MRRLFLLLPVAALVAGCEAAGSGGLAPLPGPHAIASFPPGSVVNTIRLDVLDNLPLRGAELVAPDGAVTPANWLDVNRKIQAYGGQYAYSSPWRSNATFGDTSPTALPNVSASNAGFETHSELLLMSAEADIPLPDPVVYRRDWQRYRIRLTFGAPAGPEVREIPAPELPPENPPAR